MSRPLTANLKRNSEASTFHGRVFRRYGLLCWFGVRLGHPKKRAIDAAHVVDRNRLGPLRYADERLARPLCRECHDGQGDKSDATFRFDYEDYREAVRVHNEIASDKINLIDRATYDGRKPRIQTRKAS